MDDSNIGETGLESLRINGKRIGDLPFGASQQAQVQLPMFIAAERQQQIKTVYASYPKASRDYLLARKRECETGIKDFKRVKAEKQVKIKELVLLAKNQNGPSFRDIEEELYAIGARTDISVDEKKKLIAEKRAQVSDYDPLSILQQVEQFQEDIERLDAAIQQENDSIAELTATLAKVEIRDAELRRLGVTDP